MAPQPLRSHVSSWWFLLGIGRSAYQKPQLKSVAGGEWPDTPNDIGVRAGQPGFPICIGDLTSFGYARHPRTVNPPPPSGPAPTHDGQGVSTFHCTPLALKRAMTDDLPVIKTYNRDALARNANDTKT
jgi:hypothetical protein